MNTEISNSTTGEHFRHNIDFYHCFFKGIQQSVIDYDQRDRDTLVENNKQLAIEQMEELIGQLDAFQLSECKSSIDIIQNDDLGKEFRRCQSSVERELMFLVSHTVHHYAIIALLLRSQGLHLDSNFGKAPSTITYEEQVNQK